MYMDPDFADDKWIWQLPMVNVLMGVSDATSHAIDGLRRKNSSSTEVRVCVPVPNWPRNRTGRDWRDFPFSRDRDKTM